MNSSNDRAPSSLWAGIPLIHCYTREDAIADGTLIDATTGELAEVTRQHYPMISVAMTSGVHDLMKRAIDNPQYLNDQRGVWHDILWMSRRGIFYRETDQVWFRVIITGAGADHTHTLALSEGVDDHGRRALTIMLEGED